MASDDEDPFSAPTIDDWRPLLSVHPKCAAFPELPREELIALGNDIKANGLRLPIAVHVTAGDNSEFELLDGRSRLDAMVAVGIGFEVERTHCEEHDQASLHLNIPGIPAGAPGGNVWMARGLSENEKESLIVSLNARRRQLDARGKRAAIDNLLKLDPSKSDRLIAEQVGASPTTVGTRRRRLEEAGDVSKLDTRTDAKGHQRPATTKHHGNDVEDAATSAEREKAKWAAAESAAALPCEEPGTENESDIQVAADPAADKVRIVELIGAIDRVFTLGNEESTWKALDQFSQSRKKKVGKTLRELKRLLTDLRQLVEEPPKQKPKPKSAADNLRALLKNWRHDDAPGLEGRIRKIQEIAGTGIHLEHLEPSVWRAVDGMRKLLAERG